MKKSLSRIAFVIITILLIGACSKKNDPAPANNTTNTNTNPNTSSSTYYFNGKFNNVTYTQGNSSNFSGFNNGVGSSSAGNYVDYANSDDYIYEFWEGSYWTKVSVVNNQFTEIDGLVIRVHKLISYVNIDAPSEQEIKNIYAVGNYTNFSTVSTNPNYETTQGWDIELVDDSGKEWSSYKGTANQTGSFIKIDSQKDDIINGSKFLTAKGSLSCKLYDGNGNVKVLQGTFNQLFSDYSVNN